MQRQIKTMLKLRNCAAEPKKKKKGKGKIKLKFSHTKFSPDACWLPVLVSVASVVFFPLPNSRALSSNAEPGCAVTAHDSATNCTNVRFFLAKIL